MAQTGLADASQDLITGGYALRNAPDLDRAFAEIVRLLRPGGHAAFLDFSISPHPVARAITLALLRFWGGLWGLLLHGNPRVYAYIADSLAVYPDRLALRQQAARHGLGVLRSRAFFFGMLEVIVFTRP
jgi:demethylmenaquinone methyltransferase/2-methoxy-6-polyprenyl-1,4-benzoquinol methylase